MSQNNTEGVVLIDLTEDEQNAHRKASEVEILEDYSKPVSQTGTIPKQLRFEKSEMKVEHPNSGLTERDKHQSNKSSENTSTKEFLQKENMCNQITDIEADKREDKGRSQDTSCDLASVAFDKYSSDFENATDQDIGNILEEMSKIAGTLSPSSVIDDVDKITQSNKMLIDMERSVEELLDEAEKLVQKNSSSLSRNVLESTVLIADDVESSLAAIKRVNDLEANIFQLIEQEVHKESEKLRNSPRTEKRRASIENVYENLPNVLAPSSLQKQKKKFDDQKIDVSSNSDLDDPIERHSKCEDPAEFEAKDSLRKEITDVDETFFHDFLKKSMEKNEGGISGSSSFGQEDFSHFLKLIQGQNGESGDFDSFRLKNDIGSTYPEKEITELLEKGLMISDRKPEKSPKMQKVARSKEAIRTPRIDKLADATKIINDKNELYTVDLTPRLELFADSIPKLLAEKSVAEKEKSDKLKVAAEDSDLVVVSKKCAVGQRMGSVPELSKKRREVPIGMSKSCDQLAKESKKPDLYIKAPLVPKSSTKNQPVSKPKPVVRKKDVSGPKTPLRGEKHIDHSKKNLSLDKSEWEILYNEEKHKNQLLKEQIEAEARRYKAQMETMRVSFEQELFSIKKQNIVLKAKSDERNLAEKRPDVAKVSMLEEELERQEKLIKAYESENKQLLQDTKHFQEEVRILRQRQKSANPGELQKLQDQVKDLKEEALKLNLEVVDLRQKNSELAMRSEDMAQQNSLLGDELAMFKEQLSIKNNFITTRLQVMTTAELNLKKQMEDLKVELSSKTEQLKLIKLDYDKLQHGVLPVEKELMELRVREASLQEKLQVSKRHVEREKQLTLKLKDQVISDNKKILDLTRQVKEMERIIKRKNPDSVPALLLSASTEQENAYAENVKKYENKIAQLESELKGQKESAQKHIGELQRRLDEAAVKHAVRVSELEKRIMDLNFATDRKICTDASTQTMSSNLESKKGDERNAKSGQKTNSKEDTHLLATIRGLKLEISTREKTMSKMSKDLQELQKTNRRLQREREKLLNERKNVIRSSSLHRVTEINDQNSNFYQNEHLSGNRLSSSAQKLYDPLQFSEPMVNGEASRRTLSENESLKAELLKVNKELSVVKSKQIQDLNLLQEEHEHELAEVVKGYTATLRDSKDQLNNQMVVINHLRDQLRKLQECKDQSIMLKAERDHLEDKVKSLSQKLKYLSSSDTEQLQQLRDKVAILQQRHESREITLQKLVRQLMHTKAQCRDCKGEKNKSNQLCYFRQELDQILFMLQEIADSC